VSVLEAELSTVTSEADKVLRIEAPAPWLVHIEVQAGHDPAMARRLLRDNVLIEAKFSLPVHTVVVLLRPEGNSPALSGVYQSTTPAGSGIRFDHQVVKL